MNLQDLHTRIRTELDDGRIQLGALGVGALDRMLDDVAGRRGLALTRASVSLDPSGNSLRLSGRSTLQSFKDADISITFDRASDAITLAAMMAEHDRLGFPGFPSLSIGALTITFGHAENDPVTGSFGGTVRAGPIEFPVSIALPVSVSNWNLVGGLSGMPIGLAGLADLAGADVAQALPAGLSANSLTLTAFSLGFDVRNRRVTHIAVAIETARNWEIGPRLSLTEATVSLEVLSPGSKDREITGVVAGRLRAAGATLALVAEVGAGLVLRGSIRSLRLSDLIRNELGVALPDGVPDVVIERVDVTVDTVAKSVAFSGAAKLQFDYFGFGDPGTATLSIELDITAVAGQAPRGRLALQAAGPFRFADALIGDRLDLHFELGADRAWSVGGRVEAHLFGGRVSLEATYQGDRDSRDLALTWRGNKDFIDVNGVGRLGVSRLAIEVSLPKDKLRSRHWSLQSSAHLEIDHLLTMDGALEIFEAGIRFLPNTPSGSTLEVTRSFPLPIDRPPEIRLGVGAISILRDGDSGWRFSGAMALSFLNLPAALATIVPETRTVEFIADRVGATLRVNPLINPLAIRLPDIVFTTAGRETRLSLGEVAFGVNAMALSVGRNLSLSCDIGAGLPAELNSLLGSDEQGRPVKPLFNTYQPGNPASMQSLRLKVGIQGVSIALNSSPFVAIVREAETLASDLQERIGFSWDLGHCGLLSFDMPSFELDLARGSFSGKGRFEVKRSLALPLAPLRGLLRRIGADELAAVLPDAVELKPIRLLNDKGAFKVEELIAMIEQVGPLPDEIASALRRAGEMLDRLPDTLKGYLNFEPPTGLAFSIGVTADGGVRIDVAVADRNRPLRLLVPAAGPIPTLIGMELRSFSFGEVLAGTFILVAADLRIDQFNLSTLAASLMLPADGNPLLPAGSELKQRLIIDELFMLVFPYVVVPIPIPLFYNELGFESVGFSGARAEAHASFPMPTFNLVEAGKIIGDLKRFFTDIDYALPTDSPPKDFNLSLALGSNFLQLPAFMGGGVLGEKGQLAKIDAYTVVADALNALKAPTLGRLIQVVPLDKRVGQQQVNLGPLTMQADWLICTPGEFRQLGARQLRLTDDQAGQLLAGLPADEGAAVPTRDGGVIAFFHGGWKVAELTEFDCTMALAMGRSVGFHTGFYIAGRVGEDVFDLLLEGVVSVPPSEAAQGRAFHIAGSSYLVLSGHEVFAVALYGSPERFRFAGRLQLFPATAPFKVSADFEAALDARHLLLEGSAAIALGRAPGQLTLSGGSIHIGNDGFRLHGEWLGMGVTLAGRRDDGALVLSGEPAASYVLDIATGPLYVGDQQVASEWSFDLEVDSRVLLTARAGAQIEDYLLALDLFASYEVNGRQLVIGPERLQVVPPDVAALRGELRRRIVATIGARFTELFGTAQEWAEAVRDRVFVFALDAYDETGLVLQKVYKQTQKQAAQTLTAVGRSAGDVAHVLADGYKLGAEETSKVLRGIGYSANQTGRAIRAGFRLRAQDAATTLRRAGYSLSHVAQALKTVFRQSPARAATILRGIGASFEQVTVVLRDVFRVGWEEAAKILVALGASKRHAQNALRKVFGANAREISTLLTSLIRK